MDCMHFTLRDMHTHAEATERAEEQARAWFGHLRYDIEMEARPATDALAPWEVEVTVRVWPDEE